MALIFFLLSTLWAASLEDLRTLNENWIRQKQVQEIFFNSAESDPAVSLYIGLRSQPQVLQGKPKKQIVLRHFRQENSIASTTV